MPIKLYTVNQRMLRWMDHAIQNQLASSQKDWCEKIGFAPQNISQITSGKQSFTLVQIEKAARMVHGNLNWLWGLETNMLRTSKKVSSLQLLQQATEAVKEDLRKNGSK